MAAILVHNKNLLRLCTKMAAISMAKLLMESKEGEGEEEVHMDVTTTEEDEGMSGL